MRARVVAADISSGKRAKRSQARLDSMVKSWLQLGITVRRIKSAPGICYRLDGPPHAIAAAQRLPGVGYTRWTIPRQLLLPRPITARELRTLPGMDSLPRHNEEAGER